MTQTKEKLPNALYHHRARPAWGLAIVAWERGEHRGYQFEDGQLRVFKSGFYRLLPEVDPRADVRERALDRLHRALGRSEVRRERRTELIPVSLQVTAFRELYPEGFADPTWLADQRGAEAGRHLKRHRNSVLESAAEKLTREKLAPLLAEGAHAEILAVLQGVLERSDLVSRTRLAQLRNLNPSRQRAAAEALFALLHGEEEVQRRLDAWISALDQPGWELATVPLALFQPQAHICVRPSVFETQAQWLAPRMQHPKSPDGRAYLQYLELMRRLVDAIRTEGLAPADLIDVHDFIYVTLRPAMRKQLLTRVEEAKSSSSSEEGKADEEAA